MMNFHVQRRESVGTDDAVEQIGMDMPIVGAIIHYALVPHHKPNEGVMNYGPYIRTILLNRIITSLFNNREANRT